MRKMFECLAMTGPLLLPSLMHTIPCWCLHSLDLWVVKSQTGQFHAEKTGWTVLWWRARLDSLVVDSQAGQSCGWQPGWTVLWLTARLDSLISNINCTSLSTSTAYNSQSITFFYNKLFCTECSEIFLPLLAAYKYSRIPLYKTKVDKTKHNNKEIIFVWKTNINKKNRPMDVVNVS